MLHLHLEDVRQAKIELMAARFRKRPISITFVIGGKLRALYDDDAQQSPSRITELIDALDRDQVAN